MALALPTRSANNTRLRRRHSCKVALATLDSCAALYLRHSLLTCCSALAPAPVIGIDLWPRHIPLTISCAAIILVQ